MALSLADGVLFRPLPYPEPDRLVVLLQVDTESGKLAGSIPAALVPSLSAACQTLEGVGAFGFGGQDRLLRGTQGKRIAESLSVSVNFFHVLGVGFAEGGTAPLRSMTGHTAVVSGRLAEQLFGRGTQALGATVVVDSMGYTVGGVLPPRFVFPPYVVGRTPDLFTFYEVPPGAPESARVLAIARIRRGISIDTARSEVLATSRREFTERFGSRSMGIHIASLREQIYGRARPSATLLLAGSLLFAVISWVNAGQLLVARVWEKRSELAIRAVLGASPGRLAVETLKDLAIIATLGSGGGITAGWIGVRLVADAVPRSIAPLSTPAVDGRVAVACLAIAAVVALVLWALVGAQVWRSDVRAALANFPTTTRPGGHLRIPSVLMAIGVGSATVLNCVALATGMAVGSAFLVKPGFDLGEVLVVRPIFPPQSALAALERHRLLERLAELMRPYSDSVGLVDFAPLTGAMNRYLYAPSDNAGLSDEFETRAVGRRYFEAMGIRLQQGRTFDPTRTHPDATEVVVSEGVGRSFWPGRSPVGQRLLVEDGPALEVIGVVDDIVEQHGASPKRPMVYRQVDGVSRTARFVAARVPKDMTSIRTVVRTAIEELSPEMAVEMYTMAQALTAERATERLALWCSAVGLVIAGLLVHIGTYGVVFSLVRGRRHEIGVRLVVGGPIHRVRREFVMKHLGVVATGVFAGVALAVAGNRFGSAVWAVPQVHEAVVYLGGAAALLIAVPAVVLAVWSASRGEVWRILME